MIKFRRISCLRKLRFFLLANVRLVLEVKELVQFYLTKEIEGSPRRFSAKHLLMKVSDILDSTAKT